MADTEDVKEEHFDSSNPATLYAPNDDNWHDAETENDISIIETKYEDIKNIYKGIKNVSAGLETTNPRDSIFDTIDDSTIWLKDYELREVKEREERNAKKGNNVEDMAATSVSQIVAADVSSDMKESDFGNESLIFLDVVDSVAVRDENVPMSSILQTAVEDDCGRVKRTDNPINATAEKKSETANTSSTFNTSSIFCDTSMRSSSAFIAVKKIKPGCLQREIIHDESRTFKPIPFHDTSTIETSDCIAEEIREASPPISFGDNVKKYLPKPTFMKKKVSINSHITSTASNQSRTVPSVSSSRNNKKEPFSLRKITTVPKLPNLQTKKPNGIKGNSATEKSARKGESAPNKSKYKNFLPTKPVPFNLHTSRHTHCTAHAEQTDKRSSQHQSTMAEKLNSFHRGMRESTRSLKRTTLHLTRAMSPNITKPKIKRDDTAVTEEMVEFYKDLRSPKASNYTMKLTRPQTPNVSKSNSCKPKPKSQAQIEEEAFDYIKKHQFKARSIGKGVIHSTGYTGLPPKDIRPLTTPKNIGLHYEERYKNDLPPTTPDDEELKKQFTARPLPGRIYKANALTSPKAKVKSQKDIDEDTVEYMSRNQFKARPVPKSVEQNKKLGIPKKKKKPATTPSPFKISRLARRPVVPPNQDVIELGKEQFRARPMPEIMYNGVNLIAKSPQRIFVNDDEEIVEFSATDSPSSASSRISHIVTPLPSPRKGGERTKAVKISPRTPFKLSSPKPRPVLHSQDSIELSKQFHARPMPHFKSPKQREQNGIAISPSFESDKSSRGSQSMIRSKISLGKNRANRLTSSIPGLFGFHD